MLAYAHVIFNRSLVFITFLISKGYVSNNTNLPIVLARYQCAHMLCCSAIGRHARRKADRRLLLIKTRSPLTFRSAYAHRTRSSGQSHGI